MKYNSKFMMKYYQLSSAFGKIGKELELPEYLKEICSHIASGNISREKVDEILINHHIHYSIGKPLPMLY